jgi:hypothetical protein
MLTQRRPWQEELAIIDQTMKAISGVLDPEELIRIYWNGIGKLVPVMITWRYRAGALLEFDVKSPRLRKTCRRPTTRP